MEAFGLLGALLMLFVILTRDPENV